MAEKLTILTNIKHVIQYHPWNWNEEDYIFPPGDMILREGAVGWRYVFESGRVPLTSIWPTYRGEKTDTYRVDTDKLDDKTMKRLAASLAIRWKIRMDSADHLIAQGCSINGKEGIAIEFEQGDRTMVIRL